MSKVFIKSSRKKSLYLLVLPTILFLLTLVIYPTVYMWYMIFFKYHPARNPNPIFIGLENFKNLIIDWELRQSLLITLTFIIFTIPLEFILGLFLAILLTIKYIQGRKILRTILIIPMVMPAVVNGINWRTIFYKYGPLNALFEIIGLNPQEWLSNPFGDPFNVLFVLGILDIWQWTPFIALALIGGMESIPIEFHEAALVDGATWKQRIRYITLPLLKVTITTILIFRIIDSLKIFDIVYTLTMGGPGVITTTYPYYIYKTGFQYITVFADAGYASLQSLILLGISTIIATLFIKFTKMEEII